ncbi:hypothetical protein VIGAN_09016700 [Vigna angularis var. angularis]|uniref:Uncharacterized protein n=1 Tax=Vigna angularis var. angularis TaxID=157739 RepID=A0A0S3SVU7_PHAAN|nr:uncharacterized protein LOC108346264 isoform X1 [Vigna angularis]BAT96859.1 hypothetical protein VIGAN_09016700 [Vigna angularis var. angularis]
MSLPIEVIQENQLPKMENSEEQEIKEIEKIEKRFSLFSFSRNYPFLILPQLYLETHLDRVIKTEEEKFDDLYDDLELEVYEKWFLKALNDVLPNREEKFDDSYDDLKLEVLEKWRLKARNDVFADAKAKMYDDAIAEMKRKSKMKKGSHPSFKVINIEGEDKAIEGDPEIRIQKKHPKQDHTVWATFFSSEIAMACCLGNPLDKLYKVESIGKVKEQSLINFGEAVSVYAPCITFTAIFFTNFIYTAILTRPLAFRVHANSMLLLLFMYYILAFAEALSSYGVALGSTEVPALMFVCGGAIGPMLLMGSIIMGLKSVFKNQIPSKIG